MATKNWDDDDESTTSSSDTEEEEEEETGGERKLNPFSKWKEIDIANSTETYIWAGIQAERESSSGGEKIKFGLPGVIGFEFKKGNKEHELISRIPWLRIQPHRY